MEYNPMEELGLREERQFITANRGVLSANEYARDLCGKYVRNGTKLFDIIKRYERISSFLLSRRVETPSSTMQFILPFLKAGGVTDFDAYMFAKEDMILMPGAKETMGYLNSLLPSFISSSTFDHDMRAVCEALDFPVANATCSMTEFDSIELDRDEAKRIRDMAVEITKLKIPDRRYSFEGGEVLSKEDTDILVLLDRLFTEELPDMKIYQAVNSMRAIGANEKSYSVLEIRRKTSIDFDSTMYVGTDIYDHMAMDIIKESDGLALSFNGNEFAVRASNVAVVGDDTTVIALLAAEFYDYGIEAVYDLIEDWSPKALRDHICSDNNIRDELLRRYPKKLPEVRKVDKSNVDEVSSVSESYRKKLRNRFRKY